VVGGCSHSDRISSILIRNLRGGGFAGKIFPVTPHHDEFSALPAFPSLAHVSGPVDLALIGSPLPSVRAVIRECSEVGIEGAVVFADGDGLAAEDRADLELQIKEAASRGSVRIIGPGSAGIACTAAKLAAINTMNLPLPGRLAFISQSRSICHAILDLSVKEAIGFSHLISTGEMLDVDFADLINLLGDDPESAALPCTSRS